MARYHAQAMVECAIKGRRCHQKLGFSAIQVPHVFEYLNTLRRVQHFEKDPGVLQTQVHQDEIDIVIPAAARFQRMRRALFLFQPHAHLAHQ